MDYGNVCEKILTIFNTCKNRLAGKQRFSSETKLMVTGLMKWCVYAIEKVHARLGSNKDIIKDG